jgi:acyl-coenzyme A thioesterase PaaI-like protein
MTTESSTSPILRTFRFCQKLPGGAAVFSLILGRKVPYTGTIRARVEELTPGHARVRMADRHKLRNHLRSIHAIALANLGELATGLAMMAALPADARGIPMEIKIEFLKKARGEITAEAHCALPDASERHEHPVEALLFDEEGDKVARFSARWMIDPGH